MSVLAMTVPTTTITWILLSICGQCPMSRGATETALANRIYEVHIPQQHLSKLDIRVYTLGGFVCVKLISMLHKCRNLGFHLSPDLYVDAAFQDLHIKLRKTSGRTRFLEVWKMIDERLLTNSMGFKPIGLCCPNIAYIASLPLSEAVYKL